MTKDINTIYILQLGASEFFQHCFENSLFEGGAKILKKCFKKTIDCIGEIHVLYFR